MRILVLGGTRFIGLHAVRQLASEGHELKLFHRGNTKPALPDGVTEILGDRKNIRDFVSTFAGFKPDAVIDMMGLTEFDGFELVDIFRGMTGRLVVISSADVYRAYDRLRGADPGEPDPTPLTEESPLRDKMYPYRDMCKSEEDRLWNYDKILLERAAMSDPDNLPATCLRLPMVYGPEDYQKRTYPYLKRMLDGRDTILLASEMAEWQGLRGYVEDMAVAISLCTTSPSAANKIYNAADKVCLTEMEWLKQIAVAANWNGQIVTMPNADLPKHLQEDYIWSQQWSLDSAKIRMELGYKEIIEPAVAMQRTVKWQSANMPTEFETEAFNFDAEDAVIANLK
ncbi:MAG: NAD-dependent epimerase/dehydratase family protein [Chthonomonadales bacterium]